MYIPNYNKEHGYLFLYFFIYIYLPICIYIYDFFFFVIGCFDTISDLPGAPSFDKIHQHVDDPCHLLANVLKLILYVLI